MRNPAQDPLANRPAHAAAGAIAPVGIFDSGLGGLSVLRAVRTTLPGEGIVYVADSRYAPYGQRDNAYIVERTLAVGDWLVAAGVKALVIACNTATAESIAIARERLPIPVIGVEPGIKPAALQSKARIAGVLATQVTLNSERFRQLVERYAADCRFICQPGHGLVEAVERCDIDSPAVNALLATYIEPMLEAGADTLVLGCTHYPFLDTAIRRIAAGRLELVDTSLAIARQLARVLDSDGLRAAPGATAPSSLRLCSTSDGAHLRQLASTLLGLSEVPVEQVLIPARPASPLAPEAA